MSVRSYTGYYPLTYYLRMYMQYTILYFIHTFLIISTIHTYKHTLQYQVLYTNTFRYVYTCITYRLQDGVCFRTDAHTSEDQQPNTDTD